MVLTIPAATKNMEASASAPYTTMRGILSIHKARSPSAATRIPNAPIKLLKLVTAGTFSYFWCLARPMDRPRTTAAEMICLVYQQNQIVDTRNKTMAN